MHIKLISDLDVISQLLYCEFCNGLEPNSLEHNSKDTPKSSPVNKKWTPNPLNLLVIGAVRVMMLI